MRGQRRGHPGVQCPFGSVEAAVTDQKARAIEGGTLELASIPESSPPKIPLFGHTS